MPAFRYFLMALRGIPVRRSTLRKVIRRVMFKSAIFITPMSPTTNVAVGRVMGQFSMEIIPLPESLLGGNQHP